MDADFPRGMVEEIAAFLARDSERPPGQNLYEEVITSNLFFPLQRRYELAWMMEKAREVNPVTVMEIGSDKGGGLYHWCKCLPTVRNVIACEIRGTPYAKVFDAAFPDIRFQWIERGSRDIVPGSIQDLLRGDKIDVLFIDGDKAGMEADFDAYLPLMRPGGLVFFHDVLDDAPGKQFRHCYAKTGYDHTDFMSRSDTIAARINAREGIPPANPHEAWLRHWDGASCGVGMIKIPAATPEDVVLPAASFDGVLDPE